MRRGDRRRGAPRATLQQGTAGLPYFPQRILGDIRTGAGQIICRYGKNLLKHSLDRLESLRMCGQRIFLGDPSDIMAKSAGSPTSRRNDNCSDHTEV